MCSNNSSAERFKIVLHIKKIQKKFFMKKKIVIKKFEEYKNNKKCE